MVWVHRPIIAVVCVCVRVIIAVGSVYKVYEGCEQRRFQDQSAQ